MLPKPQQSLQRSSRELKEENKALFSSTVSAVNQPKGLMPRLYGYLQSGIYMLRYLKQRFFSRNESFILQSMGIPLVVDRSAGSTHNQSHFELKSPMPINVLNHIDLNFRMITTHLTEKSANFSLIPTNHSLEVQNLIPWAQLMWHYLRRSKALSAQDKKSATAAFFKNVSQESGGKESSAIQYIEKNISLSVQRA